MRRLGGLAFLVAVLLVPSGALAKPAPMSFVDHERYIYAYVKQQSPGAHQPYTTAPETWVRNPTPCAWDADDRWTVTINGELNATGSDAYLEPGQTASHVECVISDDSAPAHLIAIRIWAPSPNLVVGFTIGPLSVTATPTKDGKDWLYAVCAHPPSGYPWGPIEGSESDDGNASGYGTRNSLTYTIANPTGQRVRSIGGVFVVDVSRVPTMNFYCPDGPPPL